ncbi:hypothetical protein EDC90_10691 [Martelella mediterranea]|uniref:Uncharacterized protein n=1 Tax=Martelella mediterranea TaxID=293089 RepID=A0A4V6P044_9HYPH|nr:hypothetical protein EDC90_10691 [Martelella mediterranea]
MMLKVSVDAILGMGTDRPSSLERIMMDTTVQQKAIAYPTGGWLYLKALLLLVRHAKRFGIDFRQNHTRFAKATSVRVGRYVRQFRRMRRELKKLRDPSSL